MQSSAIVTSFDLPLRELCLSPLSQEVGPKSVDLAKGVTSFFFSFFYQLSRMTRQSYMFVIDDHFDFHLHGVPVV